MSLKGEMSTKQLLRGTINRITAVKGDPGEPGKDGLDGKDGATPYIQNGSWWIDGKDTGVAATAGTFFVTATMVSSANNDYVCTADKTTAEITAAYNSGKSVYLRFSPVNATYMHIPLVTCMSGGIGFSLYAGGESAGSYGHALWEALIEDDESFYVTKTPIAGASAASIGEVTLYANKWVGEASPYSQVVTISGTTMNSQVDLTPSVQQLAVFHDKDLTFVTENEDGVVTVYAIGQKPANDYTIQVTITEVAV
jgi:hypothetical protein